MALAAQPTRVVVCLPPGLLADGLCRTLAGLPVEVTHRPSPDLVVDLRDEPGRVVVVVEGPDGTVLLLEDGHPTRRASSLQDVVAAIGAG